MYCLGVFPGGLKAAMCNVLFGCVSRWVEGGCVQCIVWVCFQGGLKAAVCNALFGCVSRAG